MNAVVVYEPGKADKLILEDREIPTIKDGWSLVKVKGFGINRSEIFTRQGCSPSVKFPRILGIECVGIIEETCDEERLPVGTKIVSIMGEMGRAYDGSYAEYTLLPNDQIYVIKTDLPWESLVTIPETYYTAYESLKALRIEADDTVLVRGATSGVGIAFAQLLKGLFPNSKLTGSTRNLGKADKLKEALYDEIILDEDGELQTENSYDKVLELVGPRVVKNSLTHLKDGGILCNTGLLGGSWYLEKFDPTFELAGSKYLTTFYSGQVSEQLLQELFDFIAAKNIQVKPERIFKLTEIQQAHEYLEGKNSFGKVVVIND